MTTIRGKRVLVTGGSRGIGRLVAERLASRGAHVVLWARNPGDLSRTADAIARSGGSVEWASVDVGDRVAVARAAAALKAEGGPIDILVNNAGVVAGRSLLDLTDGQIEQTFRVNALAHFWTLRAFLPEMIARDGGHVVTISSAAATCGVPRLADYAATKSASFALDESVRLELRRLGSHVQTTVVCPFYVDTGMFEGVSTRFSLLLPILRPADVADRVVHAIEHDRRRVIMPRIVAVTWLARLLPVPWFDAIAAFLGVDRGMESFVGRNPPRKSPPKPGVGHALHA